MTLWLISQYLGFRISAALLLMELNRVTEGILHCSGNKVWLQHHP
jgi:hypothetical protein